MIPKLPKESFLVLDRAAIDKKLSLSEFLSKFQCTFLYLPPYSPKLNPIERLWKVMHEKVAYNRYYEKFHDFKASIQRFLEKNQIYHKILSTRITDNLQLLDRS